MTRDAIWLDIITERFRQKRLLSEGKFDRDMADPALSPTEKLAVLAEEFGEVSSVVCEGITKRGADLDVEHLREELVQVATCCVAWIEQLDEVPQELTFGEMRAISRDLYGHGPMGDGLPIEAFAVEAGAS